MFFLRDLSLQFHDFRNYDFKGKRLFVLKPY
jgi:hypothetical protein